VLGLSTGDRRRGLWKTRVRTVYGPRYGYVCSQESGHFGFMRHSTEKNGVPPSTRAPVLFIHLGMNAKKHSIVSCMKHKCRFKSSFTQFLHKSVGNKHAEAGGKLQLTTVIFFKSSARFKSEAAFIWNKSPIVLEITTNVVLVKSILTGFGVS